MWMQTHRGKLRKDPTDRGYDGDAFRVELKNVTKRKAELVTEPNSFSRRSALADAKSHGQMFTITGGQHLTSDEIDYCIGYA